MSTEGQTSASAKLIQRPVGGAGRLASIQRSPLKLGKRAILSPFRRGAKGSRSGAYNSRLGVTYDGRRPTKKRQRHRADSASAMGLIFVVGRPKGLRASISSGGTADHFRPRRPLLKRPFDWSRCREDHAPNLAARRRHLDDARRRRQVGSGGISSHGRRNAGPRSPPRSPGDSAFRRLQASGKIGYSVGRSQPTLDAPRNPLRSLVGPAGLEPATRPL